MSLVIQAGRAWMTVWDSECSLLWQRGLHPPNQSKSITCPQSAGVSATYQDGYLPPAVLSMHSRLSPQKDWVERTMRCSFFKNHHAYKDKIFSEPHNIQLSRLSAPWLIYVVFISLQMSLLVTLYPSMGFQWDGWKIVCGTWSWSSPKTSKLVLIICFCSRHTVYGRKTRWRLRV